MALLPKDGPLYDFSFDTKKSQWVPWLDPAARFNIPKDASYSQIMVPTVDTVRHETLLETLVLNGHHVLIAGETGTAKSVVIKGKLLNGMPEEFASIMLNFSAQTGANQTQDTIDSKLEKRRKGV